MMLEGAGNAIFLNMGKIEPRLPLVQPPQQERLYNAPSSTLQKDLHADCLFTPLPRHHYHDNKLHAITKASVKNNITYLL